MYDALKNGEALTVSGAVAERFCEEYVQTITEDGENFYMPQDYPFNRDQKSEVSLESELPNGMLVLYVG